MKLKPIPKFKNENEERVFWETHSSTDYIDWNHAAVNPPMPNLRFSSESITIRMPSWLLGEVRAKAHSLDVPYQSFIKMMVADQMSRLTSENTLHP